MANREPSLEEIVRDNYLSGLDVEMDADMSAILNEDPIARLGYRDANFDYKDTVSPGENYNAYHDTEENRIAYDSATGASEDVLAHEARHAGTKRVYDLYMEDPEKFIDTFGPEAARLIQHQPKSSDELLVEFYDDPDATWLRPVGEGGVVETNFSDTIQYENPDVIRAMRADKNGVWRKAIQSYHQNSIRSGEDQRKSLGDKEDMSDGSWIHYYPEDYQKGQDGLSAAAQHLLSEDGEPPQYKKLNPNAIDNYEKPFPSWWDKTVSAVRNTLSPEGDHYPDIGAITNGYNKGGSVMANSEPSLEEILAYENPVVPLVGEGNPDIYEVDSLEATEQGDDSLLGKVRGAAGEVADTVDEAVRYYGGPTGIPERATQAAELFSPVTGITDAMGDAGDGDYLDAALGTAYAVVPAVAGATSRIVGRGSAAVVDDVVGAGQDIAETLGGVYDGLGRVEFDTNTVGSNFGSIKIRPKDAEDLKKVPSVKPNYTSDADVLTSNPPKNAYEILNIDEAEKAAWQSRNKVSNKKSPPASITDNATGLMNREITQGEFQDTVEAVLPIEPFTEVPPPSSLKEMAYALNRNKVDIGIVGVNKFIENGTPVGIRLDIPSYDNYDTWIVSVHSGTNKKSIGYNPTAVIENVSFTSSPLAAVKIATGEKAKQPFARMHGSWVNEDPQKVYERAQDLMDDPEWVQVGMNPYRHSYFYDKATGEPLVSADELIQVGALVLARNVKRASRTDPKFSINNKDPESRAFNNGGFVTPLH